MRNKLRILALLWMGTREAVTSGQAQQLALSPSNHLAAPALNIPAPPAGQRDIISKLKTIRIDSIQYDAVPLGDALTNLAALSRKFDPDQAGINFMLDNTTAPLPTAQIPTPEKPQIASALITIKPALHNLRMMDLLSAIESGSDHPIHYSVLDYCVVFSSGQGAALKAETIRVNPNTFHQGLQGVMPVSVLRNASGGANGNSPQGGTTIPRLDMTSGVNGVTSPDNSSKTPGSP